MRQALSNSTPENKFCIRTKDILIGFLKLVSRQWGTGIFRYVAESSQSAGAPVSGTLSTTDYFFKTSF